MTPSAAREEVSVIDEWIPVERELPRPGRVVDTKIHDESGWRNETPLKLLKNLWFFPDGSMYVYYRPTHWKPIKGLK